MSLRTAGTYLRFTLLASVFLVPLPSKAFFDPVTVGATINLAGSALSLFGTKANPQATEIETILTHVRAINQRLDVVEDGIVVILEKIDLLPSRWRADMKDMVDELTNQNAAAYTTVVDDIFSGMRDARVYRNERQKREMLRRLKEAIVPFKAAANSLRSRSGAAAPAVIMMMIRDVWIERLLGTEEVTIGRMLTQYDEYLAAMQDDATPDSVANIRAAAEVARSADRKKLLGLLGINSDASTVGGTFRFYSAQLNEIKQKSVTRTRTKVRCNPRIGDCFDMEENYQVTENYILPIKTVHHKWIVREMAKANHPDLMSISIEEVQNEVPSSDGTPDIAGPNLEQLDASFDAKRADIKRTISTLNVRDDVIAILRNQETAIATSRSLIASWNNDSAELLLKQVRWLDNKDVTRYRQALSDYESELVTRANRSGIVDARRIAQESIRFSEKRLADVLEQARRSAWQGQVAQVLATAQFGLQAYQTASLVIAKFEEAPPGGQPAPVQPPPAPKEQPKDVAGDDKPKPKPFRVVLEKGAATRSFTLAAQQLIEQAEKNPARIWVNGIPRDQPVRSEAYLRQALNYLDLADRSAIVFRSGSAPEGRSDADIIRSTIDNAKGGHMLDAFISSITPSTTSGQDMLGGIQHRNELRQRALEQLSQFMQIRTEQERRLQRRP